MKTYSEYRALARETLKGRWNQYAIVLLILFLISLIAEAPSFIGSAFKLEWLNLTGSLFSWIVDIVLILPMMYAMYCLLLSNARNEEMTDGYFSSVYEECKAHWDTFIASGFLMGLVVILLAIPTLFIGSVIFALAYAMTPFILHDNPDLKATEALKMSRYMMRGHKWELFVLELTFLGWVLLCILTFFIGFLWLGPYQYAAIAHFYEDVKADYEAKAEER
jgi:uncharacterized membrane protein